MGDNPRAFISEVGAPDDFVGSHETDPLAPVGGWVGAMASERGLRFLSLPAPACSKALQRVRREYPDVTVGPETTSWSPSPVRSDPTWQVICADAPWNWTCAGSPLSS